MMRSHKTRPAAPRKAKALSSAVAPQKAPGRKKASVASASPARVEKKGPKLPKARPKLVRDSFTMPESDFGLIEMLKARALVAQRAAKKSELLRAGLQVLAALEVQALVAALEKLEPVKTGRPKKRH
jgi:hypothetical protein